MTRIKCCGMTRTEDALLAARLGGRYGVLNQGNSTVQPPFLVVRFKALAPSALGR